MKRAPDWTEEQIERLKELAGTMPCVKIGIELGRSKDAVKNKMTILGLPVYKLIYKPKPDPKTDRPPLIARFKNHEAAAKKAKPRDTTPTRLEWCQTCGSPVSSWAEHVERLGCKRNT